MKPLYTTKEFQLANSTSLLPLKCYQCNCTFNKLKKYITSELKLKKGELKYCSQKCSHESKNKKQSIQCTNCGQIFEKQLCQISANNYCSNSCNASYTNKHKTTGYRRSKLEIWLEEQLTNLYPNLDIHYNKTSAIESELDIYIPSLNIAFELNGIFHYEPIYGVNKLNQIQENDKSKSKACHEAKIDLCIIDTSGQKYVKPSTSQKYIDIITKIVNERLLTS